MKLNRLNILKRLSLLAGDIGILYAALYFTVLLRPRFSTFQIAWQEHILPFTLLFVFWIPAFFLAGLYDLSLAADPVRFTKKSVRTILLLGLLSILYFYVAPHLMAIRIQPITNLALFLILFTVSFLLWRRFYYWLLMRYVPRRPVVIVGLNPTAGHLIQELRSNPQLGYEVVLVVDDGQGDGPFFEGVPRLRGVPDLESLLRAHHVNTLVLSSNPHTSVTLRNALFSCLPLHVNFVTLPHFYEYVTGKIPIEAINQMWFLENLSEGDQFWFDLFKRSYDVILALGLLLVTLPLWPLIGLLIRCGDGGAVYFRQERCGKDCKPFHIWKFRTMVEKGNDQSPTLPDDPRITRVGSFLRKTRIDELPQVLNILRGDMSFVGPRPERPELIEELAESVPFYRERMLVKPGITGWDQVSGEYHSASPADTMQKLQHDLYYIKNRSVSLDFVILSKTVGIILSRAGR